MSNVSILITADNSVVLANKRALEASAELRAARDELHAQIRVLQVRVHELTQQITAVEKAAIRGT